MNINFLLSNMSEDVYEKLRTCVETGKWLDGQTLTGEQRETCMQAVMLYQSSVLESNEHMTVGADGEIVHKSKSQFKQEFPKEEQIARFKQDDF